MRILPHGHVFRCIIMGPPGSGKGTVSERIVRHFPVQHIPCGDFLRHEMKVGSSRGQEAKQYIDKGQLVPDALVGDIIVKELEKHKNRNILLDGFPRTVTQADMLTGKMPVDDVIELDVPFRVIVDRLQHRWIHQASGRIYNLGFNPPKQTGKDDVTGEALVQRDDDKPETVQKRLETYQRWEEPLAKYFKAKGLLTSFKGETTNEIWPRILQYLKSRIHEKDEHKKHKEPSHR